MRTGQYKTENELRKEIEALEEIATKGEMTLPQAEQLETARRELSQIERARHPGPRW